MDTKHFSINSCGMCKTSKEVPDQKSIQVTLQSSKKAPIRSGYAIIVARYQWLLKNKLKTPEDINLPDLCLVIKAGRLRRAFYSDTFSYGFKKLKYDIQVLN